MEQVGVKPVGTGQVGMDQIGPVVVLGASIGGLIAARVLSEVAGQVILLERDGLDGPVGPRRGVPQGAHAHGLLAGGLRALEALYPGLTEELLARGALGGDVCGDTLWFQHGGAKRRVPGHLPGLLLSRPLLEDGLRRRTLALPNVTLRRGRADGLNLREGRVVGVELQGGGVMEAGLVVDATGRGSRLPAWLRAADYDAPAHQEVPIGLTYTTRVFARSAHDLGGLTAAIIAETPPRGRRFGVMLAQERGWTVTLGGVLGERAPEDLAGFRAFAAALPTREIARVISRAEPQGDAVTFTYPASQRRHYEKLGLFPEGLLAFGDALCSFDPIYGQGMTVAALEGQALRAALRPGPAGLARRFFQTAARVIDIPWTIAAGADLQFPEVPGRRSLPTRLINAYMARVHVAAQRDPEVSLAFMRVANLLAPPPSLFAPGIVRRVLLSRAPGGPPPAQISPA